MTDSREDDRPIEKTAKHEKKIQTFSRWCPESTSAGTVGQYLRALRNANVTNG
jgi:hypothetical protein